MSAWCAIFVTRLMQVFDADVLSSFIDTFNYINRFRLNVYAIMPKALNDIERRILEMLEPDPSTIGSIAHNVFARAICLATLYHWLFSIRSSSSIVGRLFASK